MALQRRQARPNVLKGILVRMERRQRITFSCHDGGLAALCRFCLGRLARTGQVDGHVLAEALLR